ncbi:glycosyl hydrolase 53 family protein [Actinoallomurus sp. NPDC050550]|uniref:glycosyl hydrolase 53 family protein n=1 Tax=Actinoallomurus sp. NPDC050550 TaxID=3154937 RepID=UPI0033F1E4BE
MDHISRRTALKAAGAGAAALALPSLLPATPASAATFVKGADVSWLPQMEATGYTFYDSSGVQRDLLTILKGYGINAIRLRTWVNPSSNPSNGHCSIAETAAMAKRCKSAGLPVDIDFHFGDTWNSAGVQNPPAAWASMSYSQMLQAMYDYVYHSMNVIKANGVTPGWVQIGNETNGGICHPVGSVSKPTQMTGLLNAAYDMVKEVFPSTPVLVHLAQPQNLDSVYGFLDAYKSNGGKWDITALSSYASGSNITGVLSNMAAIQSKYGKPVMQVEFGGRYDRPDRTRTDMQTFITGLKNFGGLGLFYWEPEVYSPFNSYASGAWDPATRRPTTALNGFLNA